MLCAIIGKGVVQKDWRGTMKKPVAFCFGCIAAAAAFAGGYIICKKNKESEYKELGVRLAKFEDYFAVSNKWLKNRNMGINILDYFVQHNYESIAIYGMGELGKRLYEELKNQGKKVAFVLDKCAKGVDPTLNVCKMDKELPDVDVIVVTPTFDYAAIEKQLAGISNAKILSIKDVVMGQ